MRFEWDPMKAKSNAQKHGITFEECLAAFDDPNGRVVAAAGHVSVREFREKLIGNTGDHILVVVLTRREAGTVTRIISARRANRRERKTYQAASTAD